MALDATILGQDIYAAATATNNVEIEDIEAARQQFWIDVSTVIINHFIANGVVLVNGAGLTAGPYPVLGQTTGQIE
ncbi:hypothetical protein SAMN05428988_1306 [Chitinophaga sp. YR573]|uniref:hypothetical protein n=1 Tax=Chitinophaga sp. YR573 TaxID=1881040 RepID=UPI0008D55454|nr:hypothetical protein [Chitinophaga sp. YR573]SEW01864.1 hypothetical protein SAMN05428988_1306 [Chitinophaga sp. YR573]